MAYGPLCQCAFMAGPPRFQGKHPVGFKEWNIRDKQAKFEPPRACEAPPPGAFLLHSFDIEEAKADADAAVRSMPLDDMKYVFFGASQDVDGQVYDGHKSVKDTHACLYFIKGKYMLKAHGGPVHVESMQEHPWLRGEEGKVPRRYTSAGTKKIVTIAPMDPKRKMTKEFCVFRNGDSGRRFWIEGPLPTGDGEHEEGKEKESRGGGGGDDRKKDRDRDDRKRDRDDRKRSRSRSRRRRRDD